MSWGNRLEDSTSKGQAGYMFDLGATCTYTDNKGSMYLMTTKMVSLTVEDTDVVHGSSSSDRYQYVCLP